MTTQRQRSLNSPSGNRPSPFPADGFPGPPSPSQGQYQSAMFSGAAAVNQQMRLQRQQSAPVLQGKLYHAVHASTFRYFFPF